jgi:c-di-GMP-binding flagellar brake protein YcgR
MINSNTATLRQLESDGPANEPYMTYSRREILGILQDVINRRSLVTLYFNEGDDHVVTTLLHVNPEFEELIFDGAVSADLNHKVLQSRRMTFVSFVDQIKIQFHSQLAEITIFEDKPALRIRVPDSVMRLQRRDAFRVNTPKAGPLYCEISTPESGKSRFMVSDLSVGGIGVIAGPVSAEFKPGAVFDNCRIELPGHGAFTTSLEIRHASGFSKDGQGNQRHHYGCQFLNLGGPVVNLIQRYINQLERNRRALA